MRPLIIEKVFILAPKPSGSIWLLYGSHQSPSSFSLRINTFSKDVRIEIVT
jgi:hypothetical protein